MRTTPQQFKRLEIKKIIDKILKDSKAILRPVSIKLQESLDENYTTTEFSFELGSKMFTKKQKGKGFIDGLFSGLHSHFSSNYKSLEKIKLADFSVNPIMSNSLNSMGSDAQASVALSVSVGRHGIAEFQHRSRSLIYSSFHSALEAFQFYINCEDSFHKIQILLQDANKRNRGDIASQYVYDLSKLTEVNTYDKKGKV